MLNNNLLKHSKIKLLTDLLKDRIAAMCPGPIDLTFRQIKRVEQINRDEQNSNGILPENGSRSVENQSNILDLSMEFVSQQNTCFALKLRLSVFRYLFDCKLGFQESIETADEVGTDPPTDLELLSAQTFMSDFSAAGSIFFGESEKFQIDRIGELRPLSGRSPFSFWFELQFDLAIGTCLSTVTLYLPSDLPEEQTFRALMELANDFANKSPELSQSEAQNFARVAVKIGKVRIAVADLKDLRAGDIIWTTIPANVFYSVELDGEPKFEGLAGNYRGQMAVRLENRYNSDR